MNFFQTNLPYILAGISTGGQYALIAIGYTMVYGIAKMLNFAHGDVIMIGAYVCYFMLSKFNLPVLVSVPVAIIIAFVSYVP